MNTLHSLLISSGIAQLGWTLVHFVWQGTLIAGLTVMVLWLLRKRSASSRYIVSCTGLLACVAAVTATFALIPAPRRVPEVMRALVTTPLPDLDAFARSVENPPMIQSDLPPALPIVPTAIEMPTHAPLPAEPTPAGPAAKPAGRIDRLKSVTGWIEPHLPWVVALWAAGILLLSTRLLYGWAAVQRIRRRFVAPAAEYYQRVLSDAAQHLRVSRPVRLLTSALVQVPVTIGWLRPVILLPVSALTGLSEDQLRAVLAHELAHIRRHDYLINLLQSVVETLLFYHPAVWYLSRRIRIEREHCCDDLAVACCGDSLLYARTLVTIEELRGAPPLAAAATGGRLIDRIQRVLGQRSGSARSATPVSGIVVFLSITIITVVALRLMSPVSAATSPAGELQSRRTPMPWVAFSATRLDELTRTGKPVLLHVTAAWCVNAKAMSVMVFDTPEVVTAVRQAGVVPMQADWTTHNEEIENLLKRFSRAGVPLSVLLPAGRADRPIVLPETLTQEQMINVLRESASTTTAPADGSNRSRTSQDDALNPEPRQGAATRPAMPRELDAELWRYQEQEQRLSDELERVHEEKRRIISQSMAPGQSQGLNITGELLRSYGLQVTQLEQEKLVAKKVYDNLQGLDASQIVSSPEMQMMIEADPRVSGLKQQLTALKEETKVRIESLGAKHRSVRDLQNRIDVYEKHLADEIKRKEKEVYDYQVNSAYIKYLNALQAEIQLRERMAEQEARLRDLDQMLERFCKLEDRQQRLAAELDHIQRQRRQLESTTQPSLEQFSRKTIAPYDVQDLIVLMHNESKDPPDDRSVEDLLAEQRRKLEQLIRRFIAPGTWEQNGSNASQPGSIQHWNDRLIVRHTEQVHRQLVEVFGKLRGKDRQGSFEERFQRATQSLDDASPHQRDVDRDLRRRDLPPAELAQKLKQLELMENDGVLVKTLKGTDMGSQKSMAGTWFFDNPQGDAEQMAIFEDGRVVVLYSNGHRDETRLVNDMIELAEYGGLKTTLRLLDDGALVQMSEKARGLAKIWTRIDAQPRTELLRPLTGPDRTSATRPAATGPSSAP